MLAQLDLAIGLLEDCSTDAVELEHTVHEIRKAIKRLRALLRLQRRALGPKRFARENAALRDCGGRLAGARDAAVMAGTLARVVDGEPDELSRSGAVASLLGELRDERERASGSTLGDEGIRAQVLGELRAGRRRLAKWSERGGDPSGSLERGLEDLYRRGRKRSRGAREGYDVLVWHGWRKRVKDLRYVTETLMEVEPQPGHGARELRRITRRADRLGELLGEEHDLALLAALVKERARHFDGERATQRALARSIARRRRRLRKQILRDGAQLYAAPPRRFVRALRALSFEAERAWRGASKARP
jgi:CHAD domain-containing protein